MVRVRNIVMTLFVTICAFAAGLGAAEPIKDAPLVLIEKDALVEVYWAKHECYSKCNGHISQAKIYELGLFLYKTLLQVVNTFDSWAYDHLSFWSQRRSQVFPVRLVIDSSPDLENSAHVERWPFTYSDQNGALRKASNRPIIRVGLSSHLKWSRYLQMLFHEFGHSLTYSLGAPVMFGPYLEAFADMLTMAFEPRGWKFLPESVSFFRKSNANPQILRISSLGGIRDFTLKSNPKFLEASNDDDPYFISAMVNSTFHHMSPEVKVERFVEAFLELLNQNPAIPLDRDLMRTMREMMQIYQLKYPEEFSIKVPLIENALAAWGWMDSLPIPSSLEVTKVEPLSDRIQVEFELPKSTPFVPKDPDSRLSAVIYGNGHPMVEYLAAIGPAGEKSHADLEIESLIAGLPPEQRKNVEAAWNSHFRFSFEYIFDRVSSCEAKGLSVNCTCFQDKLNLSTRFFFVGSDGIPHKSTFKRVPIELSPGCYNPRLNRH